MNPIRYDNMVDYSNNFLGTCLLLVDERRGSEEHGVKFIVGGEKKGFNHSICFDFPAKNGCMTTMYDLRLPVIDYEYRKRETFDWDKELVDNKQLVVSCCCCCWQARRRGKGLVGTGSLRTIP
jgi:hypothetical protein